MKRITLLLLLVFCYSGLKATHLYCGYISVKHLGNKECLITIRVFTNMNSDIRFGGGTLDFGDGTNLVIPTTESTPRPDLGNGNGIVSYSTTHTYANLGSYLISYREPNRMEGIVNFFNSVETRFYTESYFTLRSNSDHYQSPIFLTDPIFRTETNNVFTESTTAIDSNSYRLVHFIVTPKKERGLVVDDFRLPEKFSVNPYSGLLNWDGTFEPTNPPGAYLFAEQVLQYDQGQLIGYVIRDMTVILENVNSLAWINTNRQLDESNRIQIPTLEKDSLKIIFHSQNSLGDPGIDIYSELSNVDGVISYSLADSTYQSPNLQTVKAKILRLKINSLPVIDRENPYLITVRGKAGGWEKDFSLLIYTRNINDPIITGLPKTEKGSAIKPFPNPTSKYLFIGESEGAVIYSMQGSVIAEFPAGTQELDVIELPYGVYLIVVKHLNQPNSTFRFVKQQ